MKPDFEHIKIFATGLWNGKEHTLDMLQDAIKAHMDLRANYLPDIKFDHSKDKAERDKTYPCFENFPFSLGKVDNIKLENEKLYADYFQVLPEIKSKIENKQITTHSCEFYYNVKFPDGRNYKMLITAVSLLPAGKPPALLTEFEPHMYELQDHELLKDCTYEDKAIYQINFSQVEENKTMGITKEKYAKLQGQCALKNKACMSFEELTQKTPEEQSAYYVQLMEELMDNVVEPTNPTAPQMQQDFALSLENKILASVNQTISTALNKLNQTSDLSKKAFQLSDNVIENQNKTVAFLEDKIKSLESRNIKEDTEKFVFSLSRAETPKLPQSLEKLAVEILLNADATEKGNFEFEGKPIKSQKSQIETLLKALPNISQKTTKEVFQLDGIKVDDSVRAKYGDGVSDEDIVKYEKAESYALEKKIGIEEALIELGYY